MWGGGGEGEEEIFHIREMEECECECVLSGTAREVGVDGVGFRGKREGSCKITRERQLTY